MAETSSPCLVRSFSQPSSKSYDGHEDDLLRALSSSISFGRYMSESLAWEKWSSFTHNKYREEAERYSRPGSVAEKKAFFEARYKKIAAKKAAALVEQPSNGADDQSYEPAENAEDVSTQEMQGKEDVLNPEVSVTAKCGLPKPPLPVKPPSIQSKKTEHSATPSSSSKRLSKGSSLHVSINFERDEPIKASSPILQKIVNSKLVRAITSSIQDSRSQKSPISESGILLPKNVMSEPDVHVCMNSESAENGNRVVSEEKRGEELLSIPEIAVPKQTERPIFSNDQVERMKQKGIDRGVDKNMANRDEKMDTKGAVTKGDSPVSDETTRSSTATKPSTKCGLSTKQPSIQSKKTEHHSTPSRVHKGLAIKPQSAPLSLHLLDNVEHDEPVKPSSPMLQRIVNSKFVRAITNTARESRPQKSPFGASSYSSSKHGTSEPESRRAILTGNSKSPPTAHGSKTQPSTTICSSFVFRSKERAMKRKEFYQKLEQKLKEEQQLQTNKAMSKRTNEPKASSACASRAKPNATNHHTKEQPGSPKLGKKKPVVSSRVQENGGSRPPWRLPGKSDSLKDVVGKTNKQQPFVNSAKMFMKESRHENASPNIQQ